MKKLSRIKFLEFLLKHTGLKKTKQTSFTGNNIYFLTDENLEVEHFQVEFISQNRHYFYTILIRGITKQADFLHDTCKEYLQNLKLDKNITLDTETKVTLISKP